MSTNTGDINSIVMVWTSTPSAIEELSGLQPERPIALDPLERPLEEQQAAMLADRYQVLQPHQEAFIQCAEKVLGRLPG